MQTRGHFSGTTPTNSLPPRVTDVEATRSLCYFCSGKGMGPDLSLSTSQSTFSPASCSLPILQSWHLVFVCRLQPTRFKFKTEIWDDRQYRGPPFGSPFRLGSSSGTHHSLGKMGPSRNPRLPAESRWTFPLRAGMPSRSLLDHGGHPAHARRTGL